MERAITSAIAARASTRCMLTYDDVMMWPDAPRPLPPAHAARRRQLRLGLRGDRRRARRSPGAQAPARRDPGGAGALQARVPRPARPHPSQPDRPRRARPRRWRVVLHDGAGRRRHRSDALAGWRRGGDRDGGVGRRSLTVRPRWRRRRSRRPARRPRWPSSPTPSTRSTPPAACTAISSPTTSWSTAPGACGCATSAWSPTSARWPPPAPRGSWRRSRSPARRWARPPTGTRWARCCSRPGPDDRRSSAPPRRSAPPSRPGRRRAWPRSPPARRRRSRRWSIASWRASPRAGPARSRCARRWRRWAGRWRLPTLPSRRRFWAAAPSWRRWARPGATPRAGRWWCGSSARRGSARALWSGRSWPVCPTRPGCWPGAATTASTCRCARSIRSSTRWSRAWRRCRPRPGPPWSPTMSARWPSSSRWRAR
jgi:hypothetical protein